MNIRISLILSLSLFVPLLSLHLIHVAAQNSQISGGLNSFATSNATSSTRIVSMVDNVTVTKFNIIPPDQLSIGLKHSGKGAAPSVIVEAGVINIKSKSISQLPQEVEKLLASPSLANNSTNATSLMSEKISKLSDVLSESNGTAIVKKGWKSPKTVVVKLSADATIENPVSINVNVRQK